MHVQNISDTFWLWWYWNAEWAWPEMPHCCVVQEERRIVYVGRIPSDYTRWDLRRKFETFGEITDVSVHFREHGWVNSES